jgi:hypothetical protein
MGKGDLWNALRGQIVVTGKHEEVWKEMDKFEKDKMRDHKRAQEEGGRAQHSVRVCPSCTGVPVYPCTLATSAIALHTSWDATSQDAS